MGDTTSEDARYQFEVNLSGLVRLTQLVLPSMREKKAGKIVNVSSMGGKIPTPLGSWYRATKHALEGWSDCLRLELAQFGIDVIVIEPGAIQTSFGDVLLKPMMERSGNTAYAGPAKKMVGGEAKDAVRCRQTCEADDVPEEVVWGPNLRPGHHECDVIAEQLPTNFNLGALTSSRLGASDFNTTLLGATADTKLFCRTSLFCDL